MYIIKYNNGGKPYYLQKSNLAKSSFNITLLKECANTFDSIKKANQYIDRVFKYITYRKFIRSEFEILNLQEI